MTTSEQAALLAKHAETRSGHCEWCLSDGLQDPALVPFPCDVHKMAELKDAENVQAVSEAVERIVEACEEDIRSEMREMNRDLEMARDELTEMRKRERVLLDEVSGQRAENGKLRRENGELALKLAFRSGNLAALKSEREAIVQALTELKENAYQKRLEMAREFSEQSASATDFAGQQHAYGRAIAIVRSFSSEGER